jgi:hypothetical protein
VAVHCVNCQKISVLLDAAVALHVYFGSAAAVVVIHLHGIGWVMIGCLHCCWQLFRWPAPTTAVCAAAWYQ